MIKKDRPSGVGAAQKTTKPDGYLLSENNGVGAAQKTTKPDGYLLSENKSHTSARSHCQLLHHL